jgi:putative nucleotidyltransferase with HDIG domain
MVDTGMLFYILPELSALTQCSQNRYHQLNAFEHTLESFFHLEKLLAMNPEGSAIKRKPMAHKINVKQVPMLKFSMLLHDIGKPYVKTMEKDAILHFYGHERVGAKMARKICRRLKCSNRDTDTIYFLVRHHMRPLLLFTAIQKQSAGRRAVMRFFKKCAANIPALLMLAAADMLGKEKQRSEPCLAFINFTNQLMVDFETNYKPRIAAPPLITGHDLINEFGLKPSPLFKKILNRLELERLSKGDMTRQEALALVRRLIKAEDRDQNSEDRS